MTVTLRWHQPAAAGLVLAGTVGAFTIGRTTSRVDGCRAALPVSPPSIGTAVPPTTTPAATKKMLL